MTKHGDLFTVDDGYDGYDGYDDFIPFAPIHTFKKRFPMQLRLIHEGAGVFLYFRSKSYLQTD
jgi:hypothetical protein